MCLLIDWNNVKVTDRESDRFSRVIMEAICVWRKGRAFAGPLPGNSLGQAAHMHVPLSPITNLWARKVTAGLMENNGSLLPGGWLKITYFFYFF